PPFFQESLVEQVLQLCRANGHSRLARVRLVVFRGEGNLFDPADPQAHYIIQSWSLSAGASQVGGIAIGIFPDGRKACDALSNLKSNNYLLYVLAAQYAGKRGWQDCLVLNSRERLADSTIANLFYIRKGEFYTPPLAEGCVSGVMRRYLLEALPGAGYVV